MSLKEKILAVQCQRERLHLPEVNDVVWIAQRTAAEKTAFDKASLKISEKKTADVMDTIRQRLVIWGVVDESGAPVFAETDTEAISKLPASLVDRIVTKVREVNDYTEKDIEDLAKNSVETPADASPSA
jgi:hypothetical protein